MSCCRQSVRINILIPVAYLVWLACYELDGAEIVDDTSTRGGIPWLLKNKRDYIIFARREMQRRRLCFNCFKVLPAIGRARMNGADHDDWEGRKFHKGCWKLLD